MPGVLSILIYHRVLRDPDPLFPEIPDARTFARYLTQLSTFFNVITLADGVKRLMEGRLPRRAACITFDDGYADNAAVALPLLKRYDLPATIFVSTGFLDGGIMFNDKVIESVRRAAGDRLDLSACGLGEHDISTPMLRRRAAEELIGLVKYRSPDERSELVGQIHKRCDCSLPTDLMMSSEQLREVARAGVEIGGHTVTHPILSRLDRSRARMEIGRGKEELEGILGQPVRLFAYPNGVPGKDYGSDHVSMVRELGFEAAVSTKWGAASSTSDLFQLPRFSPWERSPWRFTLRLMLNRLQS